MTGAIVFDRSINDDGQIAILYGLANGTRGVLVATPVPEPAMTGIVFAALPLLLSRRHRFGE